MTHKHQIHFLNVEGTFFLICKTHNKNIGYSQGKRFAVPNTEEGGVGRRVGYRV